MVHERDDHRGVQLPDVLPCYFGSTPPSTTGREAGTSAGSTNAFKINKGSYGDVKLDGAKFGSRGTSARSSRTGDGLGGPDIRPSVGRSSVRASQDPGFRLPVRWKVVHDRERRFHRVERREGSLDCQARRRQDRGGGPQSQSGMTNDPIVIRTSSTGVFRATTASS